MFMQERSTAMAQDMIKTSVSRDSLYENTNIDRTGGTVTYNKKTYEHEESPDSNDSAYDSECRKKDVIFPNSFSNIYESHNIDRPSGIASKSSSLMMMNLDNDNLDNVSNASTIKNQLFRDESISYDTVLR